MELEKEITKEEAKVRLRNCKAVIALSLSKGEGRVSEEDLNKIYGPFIAKYEEIINN